MEAARLATPGDLDELAALAGLAISERLTERGGPEWSERIAQNEWRFEGLEAILRGGTERLVVGTFDDSPVGLGRCRVEELHSGRRVGVVEELYVLPDARGVGIGEAMMDLLIDWCQVQGCVAIESLALPGNRAAKNFFERFGLVARAIVVKKDFEG